jgi:glycosyltransferase involved in cell wall biosynthesis
MMTLKVAVVTPTIGKEQLTQAIASVDAQTYQNITHYVFVDGAEYKDKVDSIIEGASKVRTITLEENVGKGWYGHRAYAASSFLVNADIICYLDEDNWYEPEHVEKIVAEIEKGNDWAYSLRNIHDKDGEFFCQDNCESLGKWPVYFNNDVHHIDTSSFGVKRDIAVRIGHAWYGQWGADRQFFAAIKQHFPKYDCTNSYTMNYRLDGNPNSVTKEFFEEGNKINQQKYNGKFPWNQKLLSSQVGPGISVVF